MSRDSEEEPVDVVYTWVDDSWPGYRDGLAEFAQNSHDTNPNRTRDNLDLIRYSLRSVEMYLPWVRNIYIVTCRPQIPEWLNTDNPRIHIVHHDQIMDAEILPTYNSFAIVSYLHHIPGLSENFIYIEDDMLLGRTVAKNIFIGKTGKVKFYPRIAHTRRSRDPIAEDLSPWNCAQINVNRLLDREFRPEKRRAIWHMPLLINKTACQEIEHRWSSEVAGIRRSRFRDQENLAVELLYPYFMIYSGRGERVPIWETYKVSFYFGIENFLPLSYLALTVASIHRTEFVSLNDNFGDIPNPRVVRLFKRFLDRAYPTTSTYEN